MTDSKEKLSALMDGELSAQELDTTITEVLRSEELKADWELNHLIRDTLQNHLPEKVDHDFSQRIASAIENEPTIFAPSNIKRNWLQPVIGLATAATVAAVALLGVYVNQSEQIGAPITMAQQEIIKPKQIITVAEEKKQDLTDMDAYLANHAEFSTGNRLQGFVPYVRVVGHGENK